MKPEILVFASSPSSSVMDRLEKEFTCHHVPKSSPEEKIAFIEDLAPRIRGVWTVGAIGLDGETIAKLPHLEIVVVGSVGYDKVDIDGLRARRIPVTNTPGVLTDDVADLTLLLLLAAARRLPSMDTFVRDGSWAAGKPLKPARSLRGKVAGIFGFGRIGQAIAVRLQALGMTVLYFQPRAIPGVNVERAESLHALALASDYLVLSAPATAATRNVIDSDILNALGPEGTLVNIARGALVDEEALIAALSSGRLGGAALDVFSDEPNVSTALRELENVVLTPHIGSLTVETRHAMGQLTLDNLLAHFSGAPLLTPVG